MGHKKTFRVLEIFISSIWWQSHGCIDLSKCIETKFKWVHFIICRLYLNKVDEKNLWCLHLRALWISLVLFTCLFLGQMTFKFQDPLVTCRLILDMLAFQFMNQYQHPLGLLSSISSWQSIFLIVVLLVIFRCAVGICHQG